MPYRVDITAPPADALDVLVALGALDLDSAGARLSAILPDHVSPSLLRDALPHAKFTASEAIPRDNNSVWLLSSRSVQIAGLHITPPHALSTAPADLPTLQLADTAAFGTGHHPTTALCLEALHTTLQSEHLETVLDVGTGSGILALAALLLGVAHATALDVDRMALQAAAANARRNGLASRLSLVAGGPDVVAGTWPLVVANILAAPLIDLAPHLVCRLASRGRLLLSGIPRGVLSDVERAYQHQGVHCLHSETRDGWCLLIAQAPW